MWASSLVLLLVVGGAEVAEGGVRPAGVVEALDEREDGLGKALAGRPGRAVEQLGPQGREEALRDELSQQSPMLPIEPSSPASRSRWPNAQLV